MIVNEQRLRAFTDRIERLDDEAKALNDDRKAVYDEAGEAGLNKRALKQVIAARRKRANDPADFVIDRDDFDAYMLALDGFEHNPASRAPARVETSEIRAGFPVGDDGSPSVPSEPVAVPAAPDTGVHLAQGSQAADPNPIPAFLDRRKAARAHLEPAE